MNLFGGEPTDFVGLPAFLQELGKRGLDCYLATNGLGDPAHFAAIVAEPSLEMVTFHVADRAAYGDHEFRRFLQNLCAASMARVQIVVRYNLDHGSSRTFDTLMAVLSAVPRGSIFSFAVPFPSQQRDNRYVALDDLDTLAASLCHLVHEVTERFPNIARLVLCKPFPPCAFSDSELAFILGHVEYHNLCEVDRRGFTSQTQVNPDLTFSPCMALNAERYRVAGVHGLKGLRAAFAERVTALMEVPMRPGCDACSLFACGACQCACYAYVS